MRLRVIEGCAGAATGTYCLPLGSIQVAWAQGFQSGRRLQQIWRLIWANQKNIVKLKYIYITICIYIVMMYILDMVCWVFTVSFRNIMLSQPSNIVRYCAPTCFCDHHAGWIWNPWGVISLDCLGAATRLKLASKSPLWSKSSSNATTQTAAAGLQEYTWTTRKGLD